MVFRQVSLPSSLPINLRLSHLLRHLYNQVGSPRLNHQFNLHVSLLINRLRYPQDYLQVNHQFCLLEHRLVYLPVIRLVIPLLNLYLRHLVDLLSSHLCNHRINHLDIQHFSHHLNLAMNHLSNRLIFLLVCHRFNQLLYQHHSHHHSLLCVLQVSQRYHLQFNQAIVHRFNHLLNHLGIPLINL